MLNQHGRPVEGGELGRWLVHYTYDGLGRMVRRQTPWDDGSSQSPSECVRMEEYVYEGVRRVQDIFFDPIESTSPWKLSDNAEIPLVTPGGTPLAFVEREYLYGPGDDRGIDEFLADIDAGGNLRWIIQDKAGDVVALTDSGGSPVLQYTYDPYGELLVADHFGPHASNRLGHHGYFYDRFDGGVLSRHLLPQAKGHYLARNRAYNPRLGRFMQRDPNASGLPLVTQAAMMAGSSNFNTLDSFDAMSMYGDGMSLYGYAGSNPHKHGDALGLALDWFDVADEINAEMAGSVAAWMHEIVGGFNMAAHVAWQIAQMHPAIGFAAAAYRIANGEGDIWDALSVAGPAAKLVGKAMGAAVRTGASYVNRFGSACRKCFVGDTLVWTECGFLRIDQLQEGMLVATVDEDTPGGQVVFRPITTVWKSDGYEVFRIALADEHELGLTAAHEVYVEGKGWILAEDARVGDRMIDQCGRAVAILAIKREYLAVPVYNITVAGRHTFFANGVWVHNCGKYEFHHFLPKQYWDYFINKVGFMKAELDVLGERILRDWHKRLHGKGTGLVNSWNDRWRQFKDAHPLGASKDQVLELLAVLKSEFGF